MEISCWGQLQREKKAGAGGGWAAAGEDVRGSGQWVPDPAPIRCRDTKMGICEPAQKQRGWKRPPRSLSLGNKLADEVWKRVGVRG